MSFLILANVETFHSIYTSVARYKKYFEDTRYSLNIYIYQR